MMCRKNNKAKMLSWSNGYVHDNIKTKIKSKGSHDASSILTQDWLSALK